MNLGSFTKTGFKNLFVLPGLIAGLGLTMAGRVTAQTFSTLHSFTTRSVTNSDGVGPAGGLILSGNTLYGTAQFGGSSSQGTVFAVNTDGTGFTTLHEFTALQNNTNSDGAQPMAGLVLSSNTLYGTASGGGSSSNGTVFAVNTDGTGFTVLHSFTAASGHAYTNSDGAFPYAGLILSGNTLYGTALGGGRSGAGTVFAVKTDGTDFTVLHTFGAFSTSDPLINSDGTYLHGGLLLSGNTLYGTAEFGGRSGLGTVFKLNTDGTGFTALHSFTAIGAGATNSDGANPTAGLFFSGGILYGTTYFGGTSGNGALFAVNTNGAGFTNLHSFTLGTGDVEPVNSDGANPYAGLILSGNTLYGTAQVGGSSRSGTIFSLSLPRPQLTVTPAGADAVLTWPTSTPGFGYAGYTLQSTTNLGSPVIWSTNSPTPFVVNGQFAVTNPISGPPKFYRLSQ